MMVSRLRIRDVNENIVCGLCFGYLIDPTTIAECLHSFCRSCLLRYLESDDTCPLCGLPVYWSSTMCNLRSDKLLRDLIYKLVPGLYADEMQRRREFYAANPDARPDRSLPGASEEIGEVDRDPSLSSVRQGDMVSLCLELCPQCRFDGVSDQRELAKLTKRYLWCPAALPVGHLRKFVRKKFELSAKYEVAIYSDDELLHDDDTLMHVASLCSWKKLEPLRLFYIIFDVASTETAPKQQSTSVESIVAPDSDRSLATDETIVEKLTAKKTESKRSLTVLLYKTISDDFKLEATEDLETEQHREKTKSTDSSDSSKNFVSQVVPVVLTNEMDLLDQHSSAVYPAEHVEDSLVSYVPDSSDDLSCCCGDLKYSPKDRDVHQFCTDHNMNVSINFSSKFDRLVDSMESLDTSNSSRGSTVRSKPRQAAGVLLRDRPSNEDTVWNYPSLNCDLRISSSNCGSRVISGDSLFGDHFEYGQPPGPHLLTSRFEVIESSPLTGLSVSDTVDGEMESRSIWKAMNSFSLAANQNYHAAFAGDRSNFDVTCPSRNGGINCDGEVTDEVARGRSVGIPTARTTNTEADGEGSSDAQVLGRYAMAFSREKLREVVRPLTSTYQPERPPLSFYDPSMLHTATVSGDVTGRSAAKRPLQRRLELENSAKRPAPSAEELVTYDCSNPGSGDSLVSGDFALCQPAGPHLLTSRMEVIDTCPTMRPTDLEDSGRVVARHSNLPAVVSYTAPGWRTPLERGAASS